MSDFPATPFIDGDYRSPAGDKRIRLINPATEEPIGDVNAADFCNKPVFDTLTQESVRLLGPYSNCWHADPQIDPRHRIQVVVKGKLPLENDFSEWGLGAFLTLTALQVNTVTSAMGASIS
jgi:hypothetical protein